MHTLLNGLEDGHTDADEIRCLFGTILKLRPAAPNHKGPGPTAGPFRAAGALTGPAGSGEPRFDRDAARRPRLLPQEAIMSETSSRKKDAAKVGVGFGTALAITISWTANKSILWVIVHGILGWIYVVYYLIRYY
jgi:hypothetical protein